MDEQPQMTEQDLKAVIQAEIEDAVVFIDQEIGHERAESIEYYRGDPLGTEEEGRSQVVRRVVRDAVHSVLPSVMRVFFSSERAVEFVPQGPEDVAMAEQATDYVNYVIRENDGFSVFHSAFKNALYQKAGVIKYWVDDSIEVTYHDFSGLTDQELAVVLSEPGTELVEDEQRFDESLLPVALAQGVTPPALHDARIKRVRQEPRIRIASVPPEEFLIDRRARDIDTARYVGHRALVRVDDLVRMGYDRQLLEDHVSASEVLDSTHEVYTRYKDQGGYWPGDTKNEGERRVLYVESYVYVDWDGDGIAEHRKICTVGEGYEVVDNEPFDGRPFADFHVDPEPHLFFGDDLADQTKDLQKIESHLLRAILDSLAQSIFPRTAYVEGMVEVEDVLNTEMGAAIAMQAPGMVQPFTTPFVGAPGLSVLELIQNERERRVGTVNMALEADALQSTTKAAVQAQVEASKARLELIARVFAEGGMSRLFKGLLKLVVAHQDKPRMVRLRNEWVQMDPRTWNASMDVTVNVGLGHGLEEDRNMALREGLAIQEKLYAQLGPGNGVVTMGQITQAIGKLYESAGYKDPSTFINVMPADWDLPRPEPKQDPAELLAEVEREKTLVDMLLDQRKQLLAEHEFAADTFFRAQEADINEKEAATRIGKVEVN